VTRNILAINTHGEIVDVTEADQFPPGKTQFACGFYACAMACTMSQPGQPPSMSANQVSASAESWYAQYNGDNGLGNMYGMSTEQEYELLQQIGLHYQAIAPAIQQVIAWLKVGYPVLLAVTEPSVLDLALGNNNPYPWTPAGNHMILATGVTGSGNLLVRDSANCTNLTNPNSLRPGPRTYNASTLQLVSATVVVPPWRPRPADQTPFTVPLVLPAGWSDDGTTLLAPNGIGVVRGFRLYILQQVWDAANVPLAPESRANPVEFSNPASGSGTRQLFIDTDLGYTAARGVYEIHVGREFWTLLSQQTSVASRPPLSSTPAPVTSAPSGGGPGIVVNERQMITDIMNAAHMIGDYATHLQARLTLLQ